MTQHVDQLTELVAEREITAVYHRYCDLIDAKAFDRMSEVFTVDCEGDYRDSGGTLHVGIEHLVAALHRNLGTESCCGPTHHNVLNLQLAVGADGATATGNVHFYAVHRGVRAMAGALSSVWGRYDDRLVRTEDGWRIAARTYTNFVTDGPKAVIRNGVDEGTA